MNTDLVAQVADLRKKVAASGTLKEQIDNLRMTQQKAIASIRVLAATIKAVKVAKAVQAAKQIMVENKLITIDNKPQ
jgi:hypothetical protein